MADTRSLRHAAGGAMDANTGHAAGGRILLEDVAIEAERIEFGRSRVGVHAHRIREIPATFAQDESIAPLAAPELDHRSRNAESELELGADRQPGHVRTEHVRQIAIALVAPVEADLGAEQTGRDTEAYGLALVVPSAPDGLTGRIAHALCSCSA